jgi:hypothetical protein
MNRSKTWRRTTHLIQLPCQLETMVEYLPEHIRGQGGTYDTWTWGMFLFFNGTAQILPFFVQHAQGPLSNQSVHPGPSIPPSRLLTALTRRPDHLHPSHCPIAQEIPLLLPQLHATSRVQGTAEIAAVRACMVIDAFLWSSVLRSRLCRPRNVMRGKGQTQKFAWALPRPTCHNS